MFQEICLFLIFFVNISRSHANGWNLVHTDLFIYSIPINKRTLSKCVETLKSQQIRYVVGFFSVNSFSSCELIILVLKLHINSQRHTSKWMEWFFLLNFFCSLFCFVRDHNRCWIYINCLSQLKRNLQMMQTRRKNSTTHTKLINWTYNCAYLLFEVRHDRLDLIAVYLMAYPSPIHSDFHGPSSFLMKFLVLFPLYFLL